MDDLLIVGAGEACTSLAEPLDEDLRADRTFTIHPRGEVFSDQSLHRDVRDALRGHTVVEDLDDVGALRARRECRFSLEASARLLLHRVFTNDEFDNDLGLQLLVLGEPNSSHSASTQRSNEPYGWGNVVAGRHELLNFTPNMARSHRIRSRPGGKRTLR